jgi:hypothetical protein
VNIPLFATILPHIHAYALRQILLEQAKLPARGRAPPSPYTCSIQQSMGLPCYYTIWQRQRESGVIQLEDIHPHWYIIRPEPGPNSTASILYPLPVLNPLPVQGRGRPRRALGGVIRPTSTRRDPSSFEIPSSSAPPAFNRPQEPLYIVNSGLVRLDNGHQDLYKPRTPRERAYIRGLSSIYQTDSMVDASTAAAAIAVEEDVIDVIEVYVS